MFQDLHGYYHTKYSSNKGSPTTLGDRSFSTCIGDIFCLYMKVGVLAMHFRFLCSTTVGLVTVNFELDDIICFWHGTGLLLKHFRCLSRWVCDSLVDQVPMEKVKTSECTN